MSPTKLKHAFSGWSLSKRCLVDVEDIFEEEKEELKGVEDHNNDLDEDFENLDEEDD